MQGLKLAYKDKNGRLLSATAYEVNREGCTDNVVFFIEEGKKLIAYGVKNDDYKSIMKKVYTGGFESLVGYRVKVEEV